MPSTSQKVRQWRERILWGVAFSMVLGLGALTIIRSLSEPEPRLRNGSARFAPLAAATAVAAAAAVPESLAGQGEQAKGQTSIIAALEEFLKVRGRNADALLAAHKIARRQSGTDELEAALRYRDEAADSMEGGPQNAAVWVARYLRAVDDKSNVVPGCDVIEKWRAADPANSFPVIYLADRLIWQKKEKEALAMLANLKSTSRYDDGDWNLAVEIAAFQRMQGSSERMAQAEAWSSPTSRCVSYWTSNLLQNEILAAAKSSEGQEQVNELAAIAVLSFQAMAQSDSLYTRRGAYFREQTFFKAIALPEVSGPLAHEFEAFRAQQAVAFGELERALKIRTAAAPPELTPEQESEFTRLMDQNGEADAYLYLAREVK